jgi:hypothetical protein
MREVDPEVVADIELRDRSERDPNRARDLRSAAGGELGDRKTVGHWLCRVATCRRPVEVTADTVYVLEVMNAHLAGRGEAPIQTLDVVFCEEHRQKLGEARQAVSIQVRAKVRDYILELRSEDPPSPDRERDLISKIEALGHPDTKGLLQSIGDRRRKDEGKTQKPRRGL